MTIRQESVPVDVVLVMTDGRHVHVQTVFKETNDDGIRIWEVVERPAGVIHGIKVGMLPAKTSIVYQENSTWP